MRYAYSDYYFILQFSAILIWLFVWELFLRFFVSCCFLRFSPFTFNYNNLTPANFNVILINAADNVSHAHAPFQLRLFFPRHIATMFIVHKMRDAKQSVIFFFIFQILLHIIIIYESMAM